MVALDSDAAALEALWEMATRESLAVTALVANIARPTPAAGWRNREHLSLLDRLTGKFDLVLMLAVIHHLILREQLPLKHIAELSASLTRRWLLVEWVPPSDPMYQEWLRGRDELYGHLTEDDLKRAYSPLFAVADRLELSNGRVLLLLERTVEQKGATFDAEKPHVKPRRSMKRARHDETDCTGVGFCLHCAAAELHRPHFIDRRRAHALSHAADAHRTGASDGLRDCGADFCRPDGDACAN